MTSEQYRWRCCFEVHRKAHVFKTRNSKSISCRHCAPTAARTQAQGMQRRTMRQIYITSEKSQMSQMQRSVL